MPRAQIKDEKGLIADLDPQPLEPVT